MKRLGAQFEAELGAEIMKLVQPLREDTPAQRQAWLKSALGKIADGKFSGAVQADLDRFPDRVREDLARALIVFAVAMLPILDGHEARLAKDAVLDAELDRFLA